MPTIDIPDKICPHCGGTRWYFTKRGYLCYLRNYEQNKRRYIKNREQCLLNRKQWAEENKEKVKVHKKKCYEKNKQKYFLLTKKWNEKHKNKRKLYEVISRERNKESRQIYTKKRVELLPDGYVINQIIRKKYRDCLKSSDIPQDLIELKRKQLTLTRQIKNNGKDQSSDNNHKDNNN
jgi:hypothetical protein